MIKGLNVGGSGVQCFWFRFRRFRSRIYLTFGGLVFGFRLGFGTEGFVFVGWTWSLEIVQGLQGYLAPKQEPSPKTLHVYGRTYLAPCGGPRGGGGFC